VLEKDIENLIATHPEEFFPKENFRLIGQQYTLDRRRLDILFEDKFNRLIIVEVKRGHLTREASGQIMEYYGLLKSADQKRIVELIVCANVIPAERRQFLETSGISCQEIGVQKISEVAAKHNYRFLDEKERISTSDVPSTTPPIKTIKSEEAEAWIFQANPQRYDILNALSDDKVGDIIHWSVNQHKDKIRAGHIGLIWMSGKEAGIYAVASVLTDPAHIAENPAESRYWHDSDAEVGAQLRVRLKIEQRLLNYPLFKKKLKETKGLENLSILRFFQGTNFAVTLSEWRVIQQLFR